MFCIAIMQYKYKCNRISVNQSSGIRSVESANVCTSSAEVDVVQSYADRSAVAISGAILRQRRAEHLPVMSSILSDGFARG